VPEQIEAVETLIARERYDVVAVTGDIAQRARAGELLRGAAFLRDAAKVSRTITVPGNHDAAWWFAPLGLGSRSSIFAKYRRYISPTLEPVLHLPGVTFVGLNTAHGVTWRTLTWNPRDIGIIGDLRPEQLGHAAEQFRRAPAGDARVIVMHHNPMLGELSRRRGLSRPQPVLDALAAMRVDLVLCGHDHQEAVESVEQTPHGMVVSTAGTLSSRSRGGRPSSVNSITLKDDAIDVDVLVWSPSAKAFERGPRRCFARSN
jgi:3',5'-cyclic AMP phosphodiesterase CpdA